MLNPCKPCCCPGAPCEQCGFGYRTPEENHESMKQLLIEFNAGKKPIGWKAAELYMFHHNDWQSELPEKETVKVKVKKVTVKNNRRNPVEVVYELLVAYRDSNMIPDMDTIEECIGYLGEALE